MLRLERDLRTQLPLYIDGQRCRSFSEFLRLLQRKTIYLKAADFKKEFKGQYGFTAFSFEFYQGLSVRIKNIKIFIDEERFIIEDKDYRDLIPYCVIHEIYQIWFEVSRLMVGKELDETMAHQMALKGEWKTIVSEGKGEKMLEFLKKALNFMGAGVDDTEEILGENQKAYQWILGRGGPLSFNFA